MTTSRPHIVVVGSSNTDLVIRASHIPRPGETLLGSAFETYAGGKGANQAVAAARLGADVTFVANIGADAFGDASIERFGVEGIRVGAIARDAEIPSGVALICVADSGENSIVVALGSNERLLPQHVDEAAGTFRSADVLLAQLETPLATVVYALRTARFIGVTTVLNPAPARTLTPDVLALADWITPNETEAATISGISVGSIGDAEEAANRILETGAHGVVITLGAEGALLATAAGMRHIPARRVHAIDTVAAGDAFNGAFAVALANHAEPAEAVEYACCAASIAVTRRGAQPSLPTDEEVRRILSKPC